MQVENKLPAITSGLSKSQINELAKFGVDYVLETGDPATVAEQIAAMETYIKAVKADERFTEYVREELAKNNGKLLTPSGAKIEIMEGGTKYHFENCNDTELGMYEAELLAAENKVKARKDFLKTVPKEGLTVVEPFSGEVITIYPPYKTSKTSYKCTLAK